MTFIYKTLLDGKDGKKKKREGWDAIGTGNVAEMPAPMAGMSPAIKVNY
jgi:hypothetical protein